ncbi:MAG: hypothetical protein AAF353_10140 [Pseudomonadota bacterium]
MKTILQTFIHRKGRAIGSLILIILSTITGWYWLWGLLLLLWSANDLLTGHTWLSEPVTRRESPIIYSAILFIWLAFGFYFLLYPILY